MKTTISNLILLLILCLSACTEIPNQGTIASDIRYENSKQFMISGMQGEIGRFDYSTSTFPLTFRIASIIETNGGSTEALDFKVPTLIYTEKITGNESEAELVLKTDTIMKSALSIDKNTGTILIQEGNSIPKGEYRFQIEVTNSSGTVVLDDAIIIEFIEFEVGSYSSGMSKKPEVVRIADSPNQIFFVGYDENGNALTGYEIDFTENRSEAFLGKFVEDNEEGEVWSVNFPVENSTTICTWHSIENIDGVDKDIYTSEEFEFTLGTPGSYLIHLYK